ncbi:MAG: dicarboxylate/amino acid:cation symporter [Rickettsiales bacterium]
MIKMILVALVLGAIAGWILGPDAIHLKWIGTIFINLIMMIIAPLVFFSIVSGIVLMGDPKKLGRIGLKSFLIFVATTCVGIMIAIGISTLLQPGVGIPADILEFNHTAAAAPAAERPTILDILMGVVPSNALKALTERNILQVIFFAVMMGVIIVLLKDKTPRTAELMHEGAEISYGIIGAIIKLAPLAVFALTAWSIGVLGVDAVRALTMLMVTVVAACIIQYFVFGISLLLSGVNPIPFYKKSIGYQLIAFSTSSSTATLPTTMKTITKDLGVSQSTAAMVAPLGATINMNGTAIYLTASTMFVAQLGGITFGFNEYSIILTTIVLLSIGTAAVPSGSLIMMPVVFGAVGLPVEAIGLILGVDRILDMVRTTLNVTGDAATSVIVEQTEGALKEGVYHAPTEEA